MNQLRPFLINTFRHCAISHTDQHECDAAHIIPQAICYKLSLPDLAINHYNGILLSKNLHWAFDQYMWCLDVYHPIFDQSDYCTLPIIVRKNRRNFTINPYEGKRIKIPIASLPFFWIRYMIFIHYHYHNTIFKELEAYRDPMSSLEFAELTQNPRLLQDWIAHGGPGGLRHNRKRFAETNETPQIAFLIDVKQYKDAYLAVFHYRPWSQAEWIGTGQINENLINQFEMIQEKNQDPSW